MPSSIALEETLCSVRFSHSCIAKADITSLQLRLVATVASEVLASPLPTLNMLKKTRGSVGRPSASGSTRRDSGYADGASSGVGGVAAAAATAAAASAAARGVWGGMGAGMGAYEAPTVTNAWASKRQADWKTLEVK